MVAKTTVGNLGQFDGLSKLELGGAVEGLRTIVELATEDAARIAAAELALSKEEAIRTLPTNAPSDAITRILTAQTPGELETVMAAVLQATQNTALVNAGYVEAGHAELLADMIERQTALSARVNATLDSISETYASHGLEEPEYVRVGKERQARINERTAALQNSDAPLEERAEEALDIAEEQVFTSRGVMIGTHSSVHATDEQKDQSRAQYETALENYRIAFEEYLEINSPHLSESERQNLVNANVQGFMRRIETEERAVDDQETVTFIIEQTENLREHAQLAEDEARAQPTVEVTHVEETDEVAEITVLEQEDVNGMASYAVADATTIESQSGLPTGPATLGGGVSLI